MIKIYEYICVKVNYHNMSQESAGYVYIPGDIKKLAEEGWRLVTIDMGVAYLERVKEVPE